MVVIEAHEVREVRQVRQVRQARQVRQVPVRQARLLSNTCANFRDGAECYIRKRDENPATNGKKCDACWV